MIIGSVSMRVFATVSMMYGMNFMQPSNASDIVNMLTWSTFLLYWRSLFYLRGLSRSLPAFARAEQVVSQAASDILPLCLCLVAAAAGISLSLRVASVWSTQSTSPELAGTGLIAAIAAAVYGGVSGGVDSLLPSTTVLLVIALFVAILTKLFIATMTDSYDKVMANSAARATMNIASLCLEADVAGESSTGAWLHVLEKSSSAQARHAARGSLVGGNVDTAELERRMPTDPSMVSTHAVSHDRLVSGEGSWGGKVQANTAALARASRGMALESDRMLADWCRRGYYGGESAEWKDATDSESMDRQMLERLMHSLKEQQAIIQRRYERRA
jgi:hypothetical protein